MVAAVRTSPSAPLNHLVVLLQLLLLAHLPLVPHLPLLVEDQLLQLPLTLLLMLIVLLPLAALQQSLLVLLLQQLLLVSHFWSLLPHPQQELSDLELVMEQQMALLYAHSFVLTGFQAGLHLPYQGTTTPSPIITDDISINLAGSGDCA